MLLTNNVDFQVKLTPVKTGPYRFNDLRNAFIGYKPENFTIDSCDDYEYGKYFHIKGRVDVYKKEEAIKEIQTVSAGLIEEGHGTVTGFECGVGNMVLDRFSFEGIPALEKEEEEREV